MVGFVLSCFFVYAGLFELPYLLSISGTYPWIRPMPAGAFYSNGLFICKGRGTIAGIFWIREFFNHSLIQGGSLDEYNDL
ncbi:hypothetical protein CMV16_18605 [Peribacillus simplex]|nr:hypothetical protein CMV16_18605 [Peribacillus simplex]